MTFNKLKRRPVTILTGPPVINVLADMKFDNDGLLAMMDWIRSRRPECLTSDHVRPIDLFTHGGLREDGTALSDNELLAELAGRKCYNSFVEKAGRRSNAEYLAHTQDSEVPHASILYHPKATFFFAGLSRRVVNELIRNYVGADRDQEGSPSQESTRFTQQNGFFICPVRRVGNEELVDQFRAQVQDAYDGYCDYIDQESERYFDTYGEMPKQLERKRIFEDAAGQLPGQAETSLIWTTNPGAISKLVRERAHESADLEFMRFARDLRTLCQRRWPNLFPQPWMRVTDE